MTGECRENWVVSPQSFLALFWILIHPSRMKWGSIKAEWVVTKVLWAARGQQQGPRKGSPKQVERHSKKDGGFPKTNFGSGLNNVLGQLVYEIPFDNYEMYLHLIAEFGHKKMWVQKSSDSFYNTNCIDWKCKWWTCERWLLKDDFLKLWTYEKQLSFLKICSF